MMKDMRSAAIYLARVVLVGDKEHFGRIKVVMDNDEIMSHPIWARPAFGMDTFWMPVKDDRVFVFFESGSWNDAYWFGFRYGSTMTSEAAEPVSAVEGYPTSRVIRSKSGHEILFNDKSGSEKIVVISAPKDGKSHRLSFDTATETIEVEHGSGKAKITIKPDGSMDVITEDVNWIAKHVQLKTGEVQWRFGKRLDIEDGEGNFIRMASDGIKIMDKRNNVILLQDGIKMTDKSGSTITMKGGKIQIDARGKVFLNGGSKGVVRGGDRAVPHIHSVIAPPGVSGGPCVVAPAIVSFQMVSKTVVAGG